MEFHMRVKTFFLLAVLSLAQCSLVYQEGWQEKSCARILHHVTNADIVIPLPPDLTGKWVSYRCEIRSGPEYVLREFSFQNGTFTSTLYRYADPDCSQPLYAIQAHGTHKLQAASWTVRGGTEAQYDVISAHVIPYSKKASTYVGAMLAQECNDVLAPKFIKPFSKYLIYSLPLQDYSKKSDRFGSSSSSSSSLSVQNETNTPNSGVNTQQSQPETEKEVDCFKALNYTLHELQLVMMEVKRKHKWHHHHHHHHRGHNNHHQLAEERQQDSSQQPETQFVENPFATGHHHRFHKDHDDKQMEEGRDYNADEVYDDDGDNEDDEAEDEVKELLLGAIHSKPSKRQGHRPSSFQTALRYAKGAVCGVCTRVAAGSVMSPPRLIPHPGTILSLEGQWVSTRCESRRYGMFLTRWLEFLPDGQSWRGVYDYYHESLCRRPSFSLHAKGSYAGGVDSKLVHGAKDFSFKVTHLKVTPHDQSTADSMNHYSGTGCGKAHAWKVGQAQDVTWTGGCVTLGIRLPNMERDIMKMAITHGRLRLFVGQRLVDKVPGTAYQFERPTAFQEPLVKCSNGEEEKNEVISSGGIALPLSANKELKDPNSKNSAGKEFLTAYTALMNLVVLVCSLMLKM